ncbi:NUDIX hydrolase [Streptomyces silvisoli]|uniref:NUDIX domain-containing protein n=1 Tax=Streptomyces silvisoli TaxID=3034235 RepID=A0ABT5ZLP0_9ACTN|nr:NUDIX domain-containing protein [Streptomyces silvisoli]MDF3290747.1 NUDIX domain-containing protein [Streptomyces silvisoli]
MAITADHIRATVTAYLNDHPEEKDDLAKVLALLNAGADVTSRKEFRGHATAGAILVNGEGEALFIHHVALDKWLTPGGHLEAEDTSLADAARRELTEETGISPTAVTLVGESPVHIDVHPIPANDAKGEPDHQHIDFRFVFRTAARDTVTLQEEEVSGFTWRGVDAITDDRLRARVGGVLR